MGGRVALCFLDISDLIQKVLRVGRGRSLRTAPPLDQPRGDARRHVELLARAVDVLLERGEDELVGALGDHGHAELVDLQFDRRNNRILVDLRLEADSSSFSSAAYCDAKTDGTEWLRRSGINPPSPTTSVLLRSDSSLSVTVILRFGESVMIERRREAATRSRDGMLDMDGVRMMTKKLLEASELFDRRALL